MCITSFDHPDISKQETISYTITLTNSWVASLSYARLPMTSIINHREIQEFFTENAEKTLCFSVSISSGCSLLVKEMSSLKNFYETKKLNTAHYEVTILKASYCIGSGCSLPSPSLSLPFTIQPTFIWISSGN